MEEGALPACAPPLAGSGGGRWRGEGKANPHHVSVVLQSPAVRLHRAMMPFPCNAFALAAAAILITATGSGGISVPTGKETPITPAKVTPRPTYHPPSARAAPVQEYTFDSPEPAPLDPSWVPVPVRYLNVLRPNSIVYIPVRIPNPAARQPNYYPIALKEQPQYTVEPTEATVYQNHQPNPVFYQPQQLNPLAFQPQQPEQVTAVYQKHQPEPTQNGHTVTSVNANGSSTTVDHKENDIAAQKEADYMQGFGAKISPKQKYKPYYYLPKNLNKQATKSGYPKKAVAASSQKYNYYYSTMTNAQ